MTYLTVLNTQMRVCLSNDDDTQIETSGYDIHVIAERLVYQPGF